MSLIERLALLSPRVALGVLSDAEGAEAARDINEAATQLERATDILRLIVGNANESMPLGPFDCIDNDGQPYQSQAFQDALTAGRKYLARASLHGQEQ